MTEAHQQEVTVRYIECWGPHEPREQDPWHHVFVETKRRLKREGLLVCQVDSDYHYGWVELHHEKVEQAHIGDVDIDKFNRLYGLHLDEPGFREYVQGPGNLEPLCMLHHRGQEGIHHLPPPLWNVLRVAKAGVRIAVALSDTEIGVAKP